MAAPMQPPHDDILRNGSHKLPNKKSSFMVWVKTWKLIRNRSPAINRCCMQISGLSRHVRSAIFASRWAKSASMPDSHINRINDIPDT
ncbi:hypothetical protein Zmor_012820 [Zophobas morio]|uniref:Uncharacterized protein n=1 Tax=Zophobas morio TaxID=2755281 RepID=A0AA38IGK1_9CUCU|nr:hypothetical protein Zmor_012820 [Zophobas morio]